MPSSGEIDWDSFSFQFGFRQNRLPLPGGLLPLPVKNPIEGFKTEASQILRQTTPVPAFAEVSPPIGDRQGFMSHGIT